MDKKNNINKCICPLFRASLLYLHAAMNNQKKRKVENDSTQSPKRPCGEEETEDSIFYSIPMEVWMYIFQVFMDPGSYEVTRLVCRVWNEASNLFFPAYMEEERKRVLKNSELFSRAGSLDVSKCLNTRRDEFEKTKMRGTVGDYTLDQFLVIYHMYYGTLGFPGYFQTTIFRLTFGINSRNLPRKNALDYLAKVNAPIKALEWAKSQGATLSTLPLYYAVERDDYKMLCWVLDQADKQGKRVRFSIIQEISYLIGLFSAKQCFKKLKCDIHEGRLFGDIELWEMANMKAAVSHGNLDFLNKLMGERVGNPFFQETLNELLDVACLRRNNVIIRRLIQGGAVTQLWKRILTLSVHDGDAEMVHWVLSQKRSDIYEIAYLAVDETRVISDLMFDLALISMHPEIFETLKQFGEIQWQSAVPDILLSRHGKSGAQHVRMINYVLQEAKDREGVSAERFLNYFTVDSLAPLGCIEEIQWLKDRGSPWIEFDLAVRCKRFELVEWYIDNVEDLSSCIENRGFTYWTLGTNGCIDIVKKLCSLELAENIYSCILGAMTSCKMTLLKWLWENRTKISTKKNSAVVWNVFEAFAPHMCDFRGRTEVVVWFRNVVRVDPEVTKITQEERLDWAKDGPSWRQFIVGHLNNERFCNIETTFGMARGIEFSAFLEL